MLRLFAKFFLLSWLAQLGAAALLGLFKEPAGAAANLRDTAVDAAGSGASLLPTLGAHWQALTALPPEGGLLAAVLTAAMLTAYFTVPLTRLRAAIEALACGNYSARTRVGDKPPTAALGEVSQGFDEMAGRIEATVEGQHRLLRDVSHQLLHPIARIKVNIGLGRQRPQHAQGALERIEREAYRIERLVANLSTLSQLELGVYCCTEPRLELRQLLADVVAEARRHAANPPCVVQMHAPGEARMRGNPDLLYRALGQVVRNAMRRAAGAVCVQMLDLRHCAHIRVSDDGPALSAAEANLALQPFGGVGPAGDREGNGLDLALAQRIIVAHGGTMRARCGSACSPTAPPPGPLHGAGFAIEITLPLQ